MSLINVALEQLLKDLCNDPEFKNHISFIKRVDTMPFISLKRASGINYGCVIALYTLTYIMEFHDILYTIEHGDPSYKDKCIDHIRKMIKKYG